MSAFFHVTMCTSCQPGMVEAGEMVRCYGTGVIEGCKLPHGFWEPNLDHLQKPRVLKSTKPPPSPPCYSLKFKTYILYV